MDPKALILMFLGVYGPYILANPTKTDVPIAPNLKLVATVDGKSFFAEESRMNWTAAGDYCSGLGMNLAEITSKAQFDALIGAYSSSDFTNSHWTAGHDAHLPRQFSWNSTGDAVSNEYLKLENLSNIQYQTCIYYSIRPNNASMIGFYPCHIPGAYVLCST